MTTPTEPVRARFFADYTIRTGPNADDRKLMRPGQTVEVTADLRRWNTQWGSDLFALSAAQQRREFGGQLIFSLGRFPEVSSEDPRAAGWYAPLTNPDAEQPSSVYTITNTTMKVYSHVNDRTDRWEP